MDSPLVEYLRARIRIEGPLSFHDYMEEVLYHPQFGYYASHRNPIGTGGDFYTSADLDPIFGQILASRFAQMAGELGIGLDSFTVVELGAGKGLLARDILQHCRFRYVIVERSAAMRLRQQELLKDFDVVWADALPEGIEGCVFSNEFFDALPVRRVVRRGDVLKEIRVAEDFTEIESVLQPALEVPVDPLQAMKEGQIADVNTEACLWIRNIAASVHRGYHLAIDYGYLRHDFYAQARGTLMCYWRHQALENPYIHIGEQDITAHVNFSDLIDTGTAAGLDFLSFQNQAEFLIDAGILDQMQKLATTGDAASLQRLLKVKTLILPGSMGERFKILIQSKAIDLAL